MASRRVCRYVPVVDLPKRGLGALLSCCTACASDGNDAVGTRAGNPAPDGVVEMAPGADSGSDEQGTSGVSTMPPPVVSPQSSGAGGGLSVATGDRLPPNVPVTGDGGPRSEPTSFAPISDAGPAAPALAEGRDAGDWDNDAVAPARGQDAAAELGFDSPLFELPEEEDCTGVEFFDPIVACEDLGGLSLANPMLITDDGEWNPGEVATLWIDLVSAERDSNRDYVATAIVAAFDVESSAFASVNWIDMETFGLNAGQIHTHRIELTLSDAAPRGAKVQLHLEPSTSDGHTTGCDCPQVEVSGLTLAFEVQ